MPGRVFLWIAVLLCLPVARANAQANGNAAQSYTLQANTRVVLTDVAVTDSAGMPVRGLSASDFQIYDNGKLQALSAFEEHRETASDVPRPVLKAGVYDNDYLQHPPPVVNVLLLDLTNIGIEDQMFLRYQLGRFIDALQAEEPVAIYARTAGLVIMVQGFTADHALLRSAVNRILPRFPPPGREYLNDFQTLQQIAGYLRQVPGRKNVLWFSGGATLYIRPDAQVLGEQLRPVYDELESQRIAVYPIDVRGLTLASGPMLLEQHAVMEETAQATGGRAIYNNNGIAQAAARIVGEDGEYYTLAYSPQHFTYNNKWHKVRVVLPGKGYELGYRRGYFADANVTARQHSNEPRTRLLAKGETTAASPLRELPLIFEASVLPGTPDQQVAGKARGKLPFLVHYSLPLDAFQMTDVAGRPTVRCGVAVFAVNANGTMVGRTAQQVTFTINQHAAAEPAGKRLSVDVPLALAKGDAYLLVWTWDMTSGRYGSVDIPFHAEPANASPSSSR